MANPITAIASRSCAKNSLLKQVGTGEIKEVSVSSDVIRPTGDSRAIVGDETRTSITSPGSGGSTETIYDTGKSLKGLTPEQLAWRENEIKNLGGIDAYHRKYGDSEKGKAREVETPGTPGGTETETEFTPDQTKAKGASSFGLRQDIRSEKILNRLSKQAERRQDRAERKSITDEDWKDKGYKSKGEYKRALRKKQRGDRQASNEQRQQDVLNLIKDRKALRNLQRDQGGIGTSEFSTTSIVETPKEAATRTADAQVSSTKVADAPDSNGTTVGNIAKDIFGKKEGGTDVGNALRGVFGKKEGGTAVGNALRGIFKTEPPAPLKKNYFNK
jgi:hypothetical protein